MLKICFVGLGSIGRRHIQNIAKILNVDFRTISRIKIRAIGKLKKKLKGCD